MLTSFGAVIALSIISVLVAIHSECVAHACVLLLDAGGRAALSITSRALGAVQ